MSLVPDAYEKYTYTYVPTLRELMPGNAGLPGVTYGIIAVENQRPAQDAGWGAVVNGKVFTLKGPRGAADVILGCQGEPINGMSPNSGARKLLLDNTIYDKTGLWVGELPEGFAPPEPEKPAAKAPVKATPKKPAPEASIPQSLMDLSSQPK